MKLRLILSVVVVFGVARAQAAIELAQSPLYLGGQVPPNILYIMDDSLSMNLSYVPDEIVDKEDTSRAKSSSFNTLYYNPNVVYLPPRDETGASLGNASFTGAKINGYDPSSSTRNLSINYVPTWASPVPPTTGGVPAYYYVFDETKASCSTTWTAAEKLDNDSCYTKVTVSTSSGPGETDETTNFANWYAYYRTRLMTAKAGSSLAFASLSTTPRVGYGMLCGLSSSGCTGSQTIDGHTTNTIKRGVRGFSGSDREDFFDWLFAIQPKYSTPLRRALDDAGRYFSYTDLRGPYSTKPGATDGTNLSCRQNYTILMTDGYWTLDSTSSTAVGPATTSAARNDVDGSDGDEIIGYQGESYTYEPVPPFKDHSSTSYSNTLADVAMYYWKNDLTNLRNDVPTSHADPAFWQHMVTIGVGLGVPTATSPDAAFEAIQSGAVIDWPDPEVSVTGFTGLPLGRADDLLHAAVNSRGGFYNAQAPDEFAEAMAKSLNIIASRTSSAAAIATNSTRLDADTFIYQARFNSEDWSGHLLAYKVNESDGSVGDVEWNASEKVPDAASRNIFTLNSDTKVGAKFAWGEIGAAHETALDNDKNVLNYIRGDDQFEVQNGGGFRSRNAQFRLGDIVNSDPWFVGKESFGYGILAEPEGTSYPDFLVEKTTRIPVVYVGANDGMLHGFHAGKKDEGGGVELLAYIPAGVYGHLKSLSDPAYTHRYFVDGSPRAGDIFVSDGLGGGAWRTILAGTSGAGGRSVFALDVSDPENFAASDVMWEFGYEAGVSCTTGVKGCKDVGYGIGQPSIVRLADGHWGVVFGSGYHVDDVSSDSYTAKLFIVNAVTGELIKMIDTQQGTSASPNGLATPIVVDLTGDRIADRVYGGDLLGNLWRFDIGGSSTSDWVIPFIGPAPAKAPVPLFIAMDGDDVRQPITAKPQVGLRPEGGYMVYFGTGKYFSPSDNIIPSDPQVQTFYGIHDSYDPGDTLPTRNDLLVQAIIVEESKTYTSDAGTFPWDIRIVSNNPIGTNTTGWRIDLIPPSGVAQGERVVSAPLLWRDRVIFTTLIPDPNPCAFGGTGWIMELDPITGGRLGFSVFDLNGDGAFDDGDYRVDVPVSGKKSKEGIIKTPGVVSADTAVYKYTSGSSGDIEVTANAGEGNRGRQSWQQLR